MRRIRIAALAAAAVLAAAHPVPGQPQQQPQPPQQKKDICPPASTVTKMTSRVPSFEAALPLDLSRIVSAAAVLKTQGRALDVFLSNAAFTVEQMGNTTQSPVKNKGEAVLVLRFSNGKDEMEADEYEPLKDPNSPLRVGAEARVLGIGNNPTDVTFYLDGGSAEILKMESGRVCGRFALEGKDTVLQGAFNVEYTER